MPSAMGAEGVEQPTHTGAGGGFLEAGRGHSWQRASPVQRPGGGNSDSGQWGVDRQWGHGETL